MARVAFELSNTEIARQIKLRRKEKSNDYRSHDSTSPECHTNDNAEVHFPTKGREVAVVAESIDWLACYWQFETGPQGPPASRTRACQMRGTMSEARTCCATDDLL